MLNTYWRALQRVLLLSGVLLSGCLSPSPPVVDVATLSIRQQNYLQQQSAVIRRGKVFAGNSHPEIINLTPGNTWALNRPGTDQILILGVGEPEDFGCSGLAYPIDFIKNSIHSYLQPEAAYDYQLWFKWDEGTGNFIVTAVVAKGWDGSFSTGQPSGNPPNYVGIILGQAMGNKYSAPNFFNNASGVHAECLGSSSTGTNGYFATKVSDSPLTYRYAEGDGISRPWDANGENNAEQWVFEHGQFRIKNIHYHYAGWDWSTGCHVIGQTDPNRVDNPAVDLAGVDWNACTVTTGLATERVPPMDMQFMALRVKLK